jgi:hypothetical protein
VEIIKILRDKGMSVEITNSDGFTPLDVVTNGNLEARKALIERRSAPLLLAVRHGKSEVIDYRTKNGAGRRRCDMQ